MILSSDSGWRSNFFYREIRLEDRPNELHRLKVIKQDGKEIYRVECHSAPWPRPKIFEGMPKSFESAAEAFAAFEDCLGQNI